ncbi:MAG: response regulator [Leptospirales bacterium]
MNMFENQKRYPYRVLVVEDNEITQLLLEKILLQLGFYTVDIASNGSEALDQVKTTEYDIIFMDVMMPVMGGLEATQILRNNYKLDIPIIALTSKKLKEDVLSCKDAGMSRHIGKPFTWETIYNVVQHYFEDSAAQLEKSSSQNV